DAEVFDPWYSISKISGSIGTVGPEHQQVMENDGNFGQFKGKYFYIEDSIWPMFWMLKEQFATLGRDRLSGPQLYEAIEKARDYFYDWMSDNWGIHMEKDRPLMVQARRIADYKWITFITQLLGFGDLQGIEYLTADPEKGGLGYNFIAAGKPHESDALGQEWSYQMANYARQDNENINNRYLFMMWDVFTSGMTIPATSVAAQWSIPPLEAAGMKDKKDMITASIVISSYTGAPIQQVLNVGIKAWEKKTGRSFFEAEEGNGYVFEPFTEEAMQAAMLDASERIYAYRYYREGKVKQRIAALKDKNQYPNQKWAQGVIGYLESNPTGVLEIMENATRMLPMVDSRTAAHKFAAVYASMMDESIDLSIYDKAKPLKAIMEEYIGNFPMLQEATKRQEEQGENPLAYPGSFPAKPREATDAELTNFNKYIESMAGMALIVFVEETKTGTIADVATNPGKITIQKGLATRAPPYGDTIEAQAFQILMDDIIRHELAEVETGSHQESMKSSIEYFRSNIDELKLYFEALEACGIMIEADFRKQLNDIAGDSLLTGKEKVVKITYYGKYKDLFEKLKVAARHFLFDDTNLGGWTVVAGSPHFDQRSGGWLCNWGRDAMISLPGLTLPSGDSETFRNVMKNYLRFVKNGLLPNFIGDGRDPGYNSIDATMWLFWALSEYIRSTNDYDLFDSQIVRAFKSEGQPETVREILEEIVHEFMKGNPMLKTMGIGMDSDHLILAGNKDTQLTWMDGKPDNGPPVTSRHGKPVEINALWHRALTVMAMLYRNKKDKREKEYLELAKKVKDSFNSRFWNEEQQCLYDTVDGDEPQNVKVRPNQNFAVALGLVNKERALKILKKVRADLLTPFGLKTLPEWDINYHFQHTGESNVQSYHQGTIWPWLMGGFIEACVNTYGREEAIKILVECGYIESISALLDMEGVHSIPEIFSANSSAPHHWNQQGCSAQAWSVAEALRGLTLLFFSEGENIQTKGRQDERSDGAYTGKVSMEASKRKVDVYWERKSIDQNVGDKDLVEAREEAISYLEENEKEFVRGPSIHIIDTDEITFGAVYLDNYKGKESYKNGVYFESAFLKSLRSQSYPEIMLARVFVHELNNKSHVKNSVAEHSFANKQYPKESRELKTRDWSYRQYQGHKNDCSKTDAMVSATRWLAIKSIAGVIIMVASIMTSSIYFIRPTHRFAVQTVQETTHAGINISRGSIYVALKDGLARYIDAPNAQEDIAEYYQIIVEALRALAKKQNSHITSVAIIGLDQEATAELGTLLRYDTGFDLFWMRAQLEDLNAIPIKENAQSIISGNIIPGFLHAQKAARWAAAHYKTEGPFDVYKVRTLKETEKVIVTPLMSKARYAETTSKTTWKNILFWTGELKDATIFDINSTAQGGGVALMLHAFQRLLVYALGLDAQWFVMTGNEKVFNITKNSFHNTFQGRLVRSLSEEDKEILKENWRVNATRLESAIANAKDQIVIFNHDYQPSGMMPYIQAMADKYGKTIKWIYRSHIHFEADMSEGTVARANWDFLWQTIKQYAHVVIIQPTDPIEESVPENVVTDKPTVIMNPSTDRIDDLNAPHSLATIQDSLKRFNAFLANEAGTVAAPGIIIRYMASHQTDIQEWFGERQVSINPGLMTKLDLNRQSIIQVARMDPSKNIPGAIEAYYRFWVNMKEYIKEHNLPDALLPQLILAGHGAVDDTDGMKLYIDTLDRIQKLYPASFARDVKVARLPHNDHVLNAILRRSSVALQLSLAEGYEIKVSEALDKGIPVIAYNVGGIGRQIIHGETGYLINVVEEAGKVTPRDISLPLIQPRDELAYQNNAMNQVATDLFGLFTDKEAYAAMKKNAKERVEDNKFNMDYAMRRLGLAAFVLRNGEVDPEALRQKPVDQLLAEEMSDIQENRQANAYVKKQSRSRKQEEEDG
ncbi:MAG: glycosyltransferase, partial [Candidatus Omnitrophica bacterium]|nr:glycosyltransferase [Candidatus Omnitrophota bacterium]